MSEFAQDLKIEIAVTEFDNRNEIIRLIRSYRKEPVGDISHALQVGDVIFAADLILEEFFSGWEDVTSIIEELNALNISYEIHVNGELVESEFIDRLRCHVSGIRRSDIY